MTVAQTHGQAVIGGVAVLPGWRGRGIGGLLVQTLCHVLEPVRPFVLIKQEKQPFYQRLGFGPAGEWRSGIIE